MGGKAGGRRDPLRGRGPHEGCGLVLQVFQKSAAQRPGCCPGQAQRPGRSHRTAGLERPQMPSG